MTAKRVRKVQNQRILADLWVLNALSQGPLPIAGLTTSQHARRLSRAGLIDPAAPDELNRRTYRINYNGKRFLSVGRNTG